VLHQALLHVWPKPVHLLERMMARLMLVGVESVVLVRFLFSLPFELSKTLCQCHKQLHECGWDGWCCLMSVLVKSYNHNVEMGLEVFSEEREAAVYFF